jgi:hypothetical protein
MIRRKERQLLCDVLTASSLTNLLGSWLHELHPASALVVPIDPGSAPRSAGTLPPLSSWGDTPGDPLQSGNYASFRFGGDARAGTSALVTVTLPTNSEAVQVTLDVALSVEETVAIAQIAKIFHEGLVLVTSNIPEVLETILPAEAEVMRVEMHLLGARVDGSSPSHVRKNQLDQRIDFSSLGEPSRPIGELLMTGFQVSGSLTLQEAGELVMGGIEDMALNAGFLDPEGGLSQLRAELEI